MIRVLVIEDNRDLAFGLQTALEVEGYEVRVAEDGPSGLREAGEYEPDLIILDLMLPGMDGYRVLRALRESGFAAPVLILTARAEETDKVLGFDTGAGPAWRWRTSRTGPSSASAMSWWTWRPERSCEPASRWR